MSASVLLMLVFAGAPSGPLADDPVFQEGQRLYHELEFEEAVMRFQEAALVEGRAEPEQAEIFVWTGMSYAQLGRFDRAEGAFERAVRADPEARLPDGVSPKIEKVFEKARARVEKERAAQPPAPAPTPPAPAAEEAPSAVAEPAPAAVPAPAPAEPAPAEARAVEPAPKPSPQEAPAPTTGPPAATSSGGLAGPLQEPPPASSGFGLAMAYWAGAATGGVIGGVLLASGVALAAGSYLAFLAANGPGNTQVQAVTGQTVANGLWLASWPVGVAGALALAAGATSATLAIVAAE